MSIQTIDCCICYNEVTDYAITSCNHNFCNECMRTYNKDVCPMCRQKITGFTIPYKDFSKIHQAPVIVEKVVEKIVYRETKIIEKDVISYVYENNHIGDIEEIYGGPLGNNSLKLYEEQQKSLINYRNSRLLLGESAYDVAIIGSFGMHEVQRNTQEEQLNRLIEEREQIIEPIYPSQL